MGVGVNLSNGGKGSYILFPSTPSFKVLLHDHLVQADPRQKYAKVLPMISQRWVVINVTTAMCAILLFVAGTFHIHIGVISIRYKSILIATQIFVYTF